MPLASGSRLGPYEILSPLGSGGMVYRARDTKLNREVALKVLPDIFARDPERMVRFQREAEVLASLNHPNIAQIHGLEESGGVRALVMELVEGPTLAERLQAVASGQYVVSGFSRTAPGPTKVGRHVPTERHVPRGPGLPVEEALVIARQMADALEAAHEKGIVHRDLKPANIKVKDDGVVKVLDFGLAKYQAGGAGGAGLSNSPTMMPASMPGTILGTAAYMPPEQAKGKETDRTADVWAFGCVLYEMLTGRAVFEGETVGEILAGVLKTDPDWRQLPANTPEGIWRLLRRCLQKERKLRLRDIADARLEIDEARSGPQRDAHVVRNASRRGERLAWMSALALVALIAAAAIAWAVRPLPSAPEMRVEITTPPTSDPISLAISPDGQKIVFVATSDGRPRLWLRSLDSGSARPLAGTDGGFYPFWSPDNRSIGFFADGKLERIDIDGGLVRAVANAPNPVGGAWNRDGTILFAPNFTGPIFRISAGGEPAALTRIEARQATHRFPQFLPDGRHFLYYVRSNDEGRGVYIGQLDGGATQRLLDADAPGIYAASGHLLFVRQERLFAQEFDPAMLALSGNPFPIAEQVAVDGQSNLAAVSASAAGPFVYRGGLAGGQRQFIRFDRTGREIGKVGDPDSAGPRDPSMSPDGRRLAMHRTVNGNLDLWTLDLGRGVLSRLRSDAAADGTPVWSPDGSRIAFNSNRKGVFDLYQKPATGAGSEDLLLATPQNKAPVDWSPDGRFVLYRSPGPMTGFDLWALPLDGDRKPFPVVQTTFEERDGQFSPDGKWIAYQSNESGRVEIYVQPFPGTGRKERISTSGGTQVRWRRDGKELFYIALDGRHGGSHAARLRRPLGRSGRARSAIHDARRRCGARHEQAAVHRFSRRPRVRDEHRHGRSDLAHHVHAELEAQALNLMKLQIAYLLPCSA